MDKKAMDLRSIFRFIFLLPVAFILCTLVSSLYVEKPLQGASGNSTYHPGPTDTAVLIWGILTYGNPQESNTIISPRLCQGADRENSIIFYNNRNEPSCTFKIELAITEYEQMKGLMFRKTLPKRNGMLFIHKDEDFRYYWMKNTYIPLDLVFIDSNLMVVDVFKNARPLDETTIASKAKALYVLEINAGESDICNIKKGTRAKLNILKPLN
ncbi:MAG: DUF192 domain-containing protein [Syntrophorhabdaceae bacterium]|nr:DUF192 domain-containing protein [Syntrophorhabdaceae bacterium]